jgi:hypothetical protein
MMMSMVGKKGSTLFWQKPARDGYSAGAADIVNGAPRRPLRFETAGVGFYEGARHAESRFEPRQIGMVYP